MKQCKPMKMWRDKQTGSVGGECNLCGNQFIKYFHNYCFKCGHQINWNDIKKEFEKTQT